MQNASPYQDLDDQTLNHEIKALIGVKALYSQVYDMIDDVVIDEGLSDTACQILIYLGQPIRMGELARITKMLPSTITALADQLEQQALVERSRDPADRRAWMLSLTDAGHEKRGQIAQKAAELFQEVTGFDAQETKAFSELTEKARKNIHETLLNRKR